GVGELRLARVDADHPLEAGGELDRRLAVARADVDGEPPLGRQRGQPIVERRRVRGAETRVVAGLPGEQVLERRDGHGPSLRMGSIGTSVTPTSTPAAVSMACTCPRWWVWWLNICVTCTQRGWVCVKPYIALVQVMDAASSSGVTARAQARISSSIATRAARSPSNSSWSSCPGAGFG